MIVLRIGRTLSGYHASKWDVFADGDYVVSSPDPLVDAARILLRRGHKPNTPITVHVAGRGTLTGKSLAQIATTASPLTSPPVRAIDPTHSRVATTDANAVSDAPRQRMAA